MAAGGVWNGGGGSNAGHSRARDKVLSDLQGKKHRSLKGFLRQTQLHPFCLVQTEALKVTASRKHSPPKGPLTLL